MPTLYELENPPLGPEEEKYPPPVVVISGASSGIGRALCYLMVRKGYRVVGLARREDILQQMAKELNAGKPKQRFFGVRCDIALERNVHAAVEMTYERWGQIDWLICNAGFGMVADMMELDSSDYYRQMEVNFFGVLNLIRYAMPWLEKSKRRPRIGIVGSINSYFALPGNSAYAISKFMLRALSQSLREELRGKKIAVSFIAPGFVKTNIRRVNNLNTLTDVDSGGSVPWWLPVSAEAAAREIYYGMKAMRPVIFVSIHARVLVLFHQLAPRFFYWLLRKAGVRARAQPKGTVA